jgi:hypothetical protein
MNSASNQQWSSSMPDNVEDPGVAFALGGLAGNNAHGAGFLQAALDRKIRPKYLSCTSGQILWAYYYLIADPDKKDSLRDILAEAISGIQPFHQPDADLAYLVVRGKPGVMRLASYEIALDTYKNMLSAFVDMAHNWGRTFYLKEFLGTLPARTMVPLFEDEFFKQISETFNGSDIAIMFNSYEPRQGIEYVHLNEAAREQLGLDPGSKKSYRDRTIYRDITYNYVRSGLWLYQFGFGDRFNAIDGAYYRQIILSELAKAHTIYIARPINKKWLGELPTSLLSLEDMKTELNFNGTYHAERDRILLVNKWVRERVLDRKKYHEISLYEIEIESQECFFDYVFEKMELFDAARHHAVRAFKGAIRPLV